MKKNLTVITLALLFITSLTFAGPGRGKSEAPGQNMGPTIVEVALGINGGSSLNDLDPNGEFYLLIEAIKAADPEVARTLSGKRQLTVFAPDNAAFVDLLNALVADPESGITSLEDLLAETDLLTEVLLYHVAPGSRYSEAVLGSRWIRTLNKRFIAQDGGQLIDETEGVSNIIGVDNPASNGVIHVIDRVLLINP